jgi:hypothetical protein
MPTQAGYALDTYSDNVSSSWRRCHLRTDSLNPVPFCSCWKRLSRYHRPPALTRRMPAKQKYRSAARANGGVTVERIAQTIGMIVEFFMLVAVLKVGIALLLPGLRTSAYSVAVRDTASSNIEEAIHQPMIAHWSIDQVEAMRESLFEMGPY